MSEFELQLSFRGSVLIGGHSAVPDGAHASHARLDDGRPMIPASAIRGALRESLEGLLRAEGIAACSGGDGVEPRTSRGAQGGPCQLDEGRPCRACRLFGGGRRQLPQGERTFSALVLGEALPGEDIILWQKRHNVAIDRRRQSAADKMLVQRQIPEDDLTYVATGRLTSIGGTLKQDFEAAVCATSHIGAGRSSGLARVDVKVDWTLPEITARALPEGSDIELSIVLKTPASIGLPTADGNFKDTRLCIPGSALRGAVGFALAEILEDPSDPDFQALVAENEQGAIFDFLYPVDDLTEAGAAGPWPLTARRCKAHLSHGVFDTLLDRIAVDAIDSAEDAARIADRVLISCPVAGCGHPLRSPTGGRRAKGLPGVQIVTRVAMDRQRSSARDQALFTHAQIERGTRFVGRIRNIHASGRAHLARALAAPLSLGRARAMGWGAISIEKIEAPRAAPSIEARARAFDDALTKHLDRMGLRGDRVGRLIVFTLLSPLLLSPDDDGRAVLAAALDRSVAWPIVARRFDLERGWDQRTGPRKIARAARAGSVFVAELPAGQHWAEVVASLTRLEEQGAGERTRQGFGRILCFDPFIGEGAGTREHE